MPSTNPVPGRFGLLLDSLYLLRRGNRHPTQLRATPNLILPCPKQRELPGPGLGDLRLDLDRYARTSDARTVEHLVHTVDHGFLEPCLDLLGLVLVALDQDLVVHAGYRHRTRALCAPLPEEGQGELEAVCVRTLHGGVDPLGEREIQKKRRHLPIRQLVCRAGDAVQAIKPVFMMSPLSIANFLEPGALNFDLVVFDEASQVKPVEALG